MHSGEVVAAAHYAIGAPEQRGKENAECAQQYLGTFMLAVGAWTGARGMDLWRGDGRHRDTIEMYVGTSQNPNI